MSRYGYKIIIPVLTAALFISGCGAGNGGTKSVSGQPVPPDSSASLESSTPPASSEQLDAAPSEAVKSGFGKVLIAYYSLQGHTREAANLIKDMTGAEIFEIQPVENYLRADVEEIAKKQVAEGYKPELKNSVSNIEEYDTIFIGSPVWWYSVSPPVMSFLSQYDFEGKTVVPFCTYGSAYGDFFKMFKDACPGAEVLDGMDVTNSESEDMDKVKEKIRLWLEEIQKEK